MYIKIYLDPNDNSQYIVLRISLLKYRHNSHNRIFYRPLFVFFFPSSGSCGSLDPIHFIKLIVTKYGIYLGKNNIIMYFNFIIIN